MESYERTSFHRTCGVVATACRRRGSDATREVPAVIVVWINWQLGETGRADWDGGEVAVLTKPGNSRWREGASVEGGRKKRR